MGNNIFADTNILIYLLDGNKKIVPWIHGKTIHISFVTEMELLSKKNITKREIKNIELLIEACVLYDFNAHIKQEATILMRNNRLKMPDAIIAATANYYHIPLLTADFAFKNLSNCNVIEI